MPASTLPAASSTPVTLTPDEDRAWVRAWEFYIGDGKTPAQADSLAYADLLVYSPRLHALAAAGPIHLLP